MNLLKLVITTVVALGLGVAGWYYRHTAPVTGAARAVGIQMESTTPDAAATLHAAGVHKCVGAHGTAYLEGPCPAGSHEVAAHGGTMTVTSFPKPVPPPMSAASMLGGQILKPMDPEERDRLRDKAIEDAANRR